MSFCQIGLHSELEASQGYIVRPYLKDRRGRGEEGERKEGKGLCLRRLEERIRIWKERG